MRKIFLQITLAALFPLTAHAVNADLAPPPDSTSQVATVYQDMIVVQRKAKEKAHKILFNPSMVAEFSDGPQSIYALNIDLGYAFSDQWEGYLSVAPAFVTQDRQIKKSVSDLTLANGQKAELVSPKRKMQVGGELLWLPAYGKDSWGPYSIVRSDTFLKLFAGQIQYTSGSGMRFGLGIGKTFFISNNFNLRVAGSFGMQDIIVNDTKASSQMGLFELGTVYYF